jgi:hypothetical protein
MPPKKDKAITLARSYIAKCTRCGKKHAPPLNELCLALLTNEQLDGDLENDEGEEEVALQPQIDGQAQSPNDGASASTEAAAGKY